MNSLATSAFAAAFDYAGHAAKAHARVGTSLKVTRNCGRVWDPCGFVGRGSVRKQSALDFTKGSAA